ncbi:hypothetical protein Tco_0210558 [Tanacetum coccineum]
MTFAMSTQPYIFAAGSENRPHMLNKDNYVPWSIRLLRYAKSKPNRKLLINSILYGPYVRQIELSNPDREVPIAESFHKQTNEELTKNEVKQMEADDQTIQYILMCLPKDIYAAVDSCETAQESWLRIQQMMKGNQLSLTILPEWKLHITIVCQTKDFHQVDYTQLYDFLKMKQEEVNEFRAERLAKTHGPLALMANSQNPYNYPVISALVISISSDSLNESVGSSIPRVILIGFIPIEVPVVPADLPVALEVGAAAVASPAEVLKLDTHSSLESGPSEGLMPPIPVAPMRSRVASRPSSPSGSLSPTNSTSEIPTAPIQPAPPAIVAPSTDIISPIIAPPEPCRALTARKSVGPLPSHRLALRRSSASPPLGMRPMLWLWSPASSTRFSSIAESSPSDSPATTSDRHSHSPSHFAGPSRKRCRSPATTVFSFIPTLGALVTTRADLLLPRKRFRDSYSSEDSVEDDIDADMLVDIKADAGAIEVAADMDIEAGVDTGIGIEVGDDIKDVNEGDAESSDRGTIEVGVDVVAGIDILDDMLMPDVVKHLEQVKEVVQGIYGHVMEIPLQRLEGIEMRQRQLEAESLIASGERAGLLDRVEALERSNARLRDTLRMESVRSNRLQ